jgi:hypothetical protein
LSATPLTNGRCWFECHPDDDVFAIADAALDATAAVGARAHATVLQQANSHKLA